YIIFYLHIDILSNYTKCLVTLNLIGSNSSSAYRSGSFLAWKLIKIYLFKSVQSKILAHCF
ncbi:hypothetical protein CYT51_05410, partial [Campylobacter coli]|nr:hypothetical protein [Campylobacter coli]